jgi:hypothetical protein
MSRLSLKGSEQLAGQRGIAACAHAADFFHSLHHGKMQLGIHP